MPHETNTTDSTGLPSLTLEEEIDGELQPLLVEGDGPINARALSARWAIAQDLAGAGLLDEAAEQMRRLLEEEIEQLGCGNRIVLETRADLARTLHEAQRVDEALEVLQELMQEQARLFFSPEYSLATRQQIGFILGREGRFQEAFDWLQQTLGRQMTALGPAHPITCNTQATLDDLLRHARWAGAQLPDASTSHGS